MSVVSERKGNVFPSRNCDSGFSLVELSIYIVILGIITIVIFMSLQSLFFSEVNVRKETNFASEAQVASSVLRDDIKNARAFRVSDREVLVSTAGTNRNQLTWECVRWNINSNGQLTRQGATGQTPISWGGEAVFLSNVSHSNSEPVFSGGSAASAAGSATASLNYNFMPVSGAEGVTGVISNRIAGAGGSCW